MFIEVMGLKEKPVLTNLEHIVEIVSDGEGCKIVYHDNDTGNILTSYEEVKKKISHLQRTTI